MKKILILFGILFSVANLYSQKFFLKASIDYCYGLKGESSEVYSTVTDYTNSIAESYNIYQNVDMKLGSGFSPSLSLGYMINKNCGIEVSAMYFFGNKFRIDFYDDYKYQQITSSSNYTYTYSAKVLNVIPSIILKANYGNVNIYTTQGFMFGFGKIYQNISTNGYNSYSGPSSPFVNIEEEWEIQGNRFYGVQTSFGLEYLFIDNFYLFGEVKASFQRYTPEKSIMVSYFYEGVDKLDQLSTKDKEINYVEVEDENKQIPDYLPDEIANKSYFINRLGLNFGFRYCF